MQKLKAATVCLALLVVLACAPSTPAPTQAGSPQATATETGLKPGQRAPEFQLTTLEGQPLTSAQLSGKPLVLYFFATW